MKNVIKYLFEKYILIIISGILLVLPFNYPRLFIVAWIAFIPALHSLRKEKSLFQGFIKGWLLGIVYMIGIAYWLYFPLRIEGFPVPLIILMLLILFVLLGSIYGLWGLIFLKLHDKKTFHPFYFALSWVSIEYFRFLLLWFFPLGYIGYTQSEFLYFSQGAELGGIFLISFLVLLINGYLFKLIEYNHKKSLLSLIVLLIIIFTFGSFRVNRYTDLQNSKIEVGIVQTNLPQKEKWLPENIEKNIDIIVNSAYKMEDSNLVIAPESSFTFDFIRNEYFRNKFKEKNEELETYLQIGSLSIKKDGGREKYNSLFLISPDNQIKNRYDKNRLVLFGEYIPLENLINYLPGLNLRSLTAYDHIEIFETEAGSWRNVICSEILNPVLLQKNIKKTDFIVNPSNEAWFHISSLQKQMWKAAIFRAIENRKSVVKSGNIAYNGMVHPAGDYENTPVQQDSYFTKKITLNNETTIYQKWGNFPGYLSLFFLIIFIVFRSIKFYRKKFSS